MKKRFTYVLPFIVCFLVIAILGACAPKIDSLQEDSTEGIQTSQEITITDFDGKTYTFENTLDTVIIDWSLKGGPFLVMSSLLGEDVCKYIALMDEGLKNDRKDMYDQFVKSVPQLTNVETTGQMNSESFDIEKALASGADAAILPLRLKPTIEESIQPKLEAVGIPVIYVDYHSQINHLESTELLGKLFGKEDRAAQLNAFYTDHVNAVYDKVNEILTNEERVTVYIEAAYTGSDEFSSSYQNGSSWGKICYDVGGYCISTDVLEGTGACVVEPEFVLSSNPDKIILVGS
jgi:iron complex transport system substrate-binding protein